MADQRSDLCETLSTEAPDFQPLFIREEEEEEEEEERFEDCVEELQSALGFSRKCRAAMEEEFSGLMAQMMAEIEEYDSLLHSATLGCCLTDDGHGHAHGYGSLLGGVVPAYGLTPPQPHPPPAAPAAPSLGVQLSPRAAGTTPDLKGALHSRVSTMPQHTSEGDEQSQQNTAEHGVREENRKSENVQKGDAYPAASMPEMTRGSDTRTGTGSGVNPLLELALEVPVGSGVNPLLELALEVPVGSGVNPLLELAPVTEVTEGSGVNPLFDLTQVPEVIVGSEVNPLFDLTQVTEVTVGSEVNPLLELTAEETEGSEVKLIPDGSQVLEVTRDLDALGLLFEGCIAEVAGLERRRDELVSELLELERPLAEEVQVLRDELGEAHTQLQRCSVQKDEVRESVRTLKRQLFAVAKACAQSQVELSSRKHQVQRLSSEQEDLEAQFQALTDEAAQIRSDHQMRLQTLHELHEAQGSSAPSSADLSPGRRAPCDLQHYLQGALSSLEQWYEPRLLALLRRRETGQEALLRAREQAQGLRSQLGPLQDQHQRLLLQRTCLQERCRLMEEQRLESVQQYKETVEQLEESSRELRMELQLQQRKTREMEALKNSLVQQLCLYRANPEDHEEVKPPALGDHSNKQPCMVEVQT